MVKNVFFKTHCKISISRYLDNVIESYTNIRFRLLDVLFSERMSGMR